MDRRAVSAVRPPGVEKMKGSSIEICFEYLNSLLLALRTDFLTLF